MSDQDFIRSEKGVRCSKRNDNVLKKFPFLNKADFSNASIALSECNGYCGRIKSCWGCSIECDVSCQWNAIPECGQKEKWNGEMVGDISQKPGISQLTIKY